MFAGFRRELAHEAGAVLSNVKRTNYVGRSVFWQNAARPPSNGLDTLADTLSAKPAASGSLPSGKQLVVQSIVGLHDIVGGPVLAFGRAGECAALEL